MGQWQALPPEGNNKRRHKNVVSKGINPFETPIVVDMGVSERFASFGVDFCPCLTRSRAGDFGYWCSKGGPLSIADMCRLQGFDEAERRRHCAPVRSLPWERDVRECVAAPRLREARQHTVTAPPGASGADGVGRLCASSPAFAAAAPPPPLPLGLAPATSSCHHRRRWGLLSSSPPLGLAPATSITCRQQSNYKDTL